MTTLRQLSKDLDMTERVIQNRLDDLFRIYEIDKKWFKQGFNDDANTNTPYEFTNKSFEIMKVLIKALQAYPLVKSELKIKNEKAREAQKNKLTVNELQEYYEALIEAIDSEIGERALRVKIMQSASYEKTVTEIEGSKHLSNKLSHLLAASTNIPEIARMELWTRLYKEIDRLIYDCFDIKVALEEEYEKNCEEILEEFNFQWQCLSNPSTPRFGRSLEEIKEDLIKQYEQKLEVLSESKNEIYEYRSLDQLLVQMMLEDAHKKHFSTHLKGLLIEGAKIKEYDYDIEIIKNLVEKENQYIQESKNEESKQYTELVKRTTGYSVQELEEIDLKNTEIKAKQKRVELQQVFEQIETTVDRTKDLISTSQQKVNDYPLEHLNRRYIGAQLQSIYNGLNHLHEDISGVLYEQLTIHEKNDYTRVLEVIEQSIASIEMLNQPSRVREGMQEEFYKDYLKFFEETKQSINSFQSKAQAFTISTSIEALEKKLRK